MFSDAVNIFIVVSAVYLWVSFGPVASQVSLLTFLTKLTCIVLSVGHSVGPSVRKHCPCKNSTIRIDTQFLFLDAPSHL